MKLGLRIGPSPNLRFHLRNPLVGYATEPLTLEASAIDGSVIDSAILPALKPPYINRDDGALRSAAFARAADGVIDHGCEATATTAMVSSHGRCSPSRDPHTYITSTTPTASDKWQAESPETEQDVHTAEYLIRGGQATVRVLQRSSVGACATESIARG